MPLYNYAPPQPLSRSDFWRHLAIEYFINILSKWEEFQFKPSSVDNEL